eukprot:330854_1
MNNNHNASQLKLQLESNMAKCCCRCSLWISVHIWLISMLIVTGFFVYSGIDSWNEYPIGVILLMVFIYIYGVISIILCGFGIYQCKPLYIMSFNIYLSINILLASFMIIYSIVKEDYVTAAEGSIFIAPFVWCLYEFRRVKKWAQHLNPSNVSFKLIWNCIKKTVKNIKKLFRQCKCCKTSNVVNNQVALPLNPPNNNHNNIPPQNNIQWQFNNNNQNNNNNQSLKYIWQCFLDGAWQNYDAPISQYIESKFAQNAVKIFECQIRNSKYYINLNDMTQSNAMTGEQRQIRRSQKHSVNNINNNNENYNVQHPNAPPPYRPLNDYVERSNKCNQVYANNNNDNVASNNNNEQLQISNQESEKCKDEYKDRLSLGMGLSASLNINKEHPLDPPPPYRPSNAHIVSEAVDVNRMNNNDASEPIERHEGGRDVMDTAGAHNAPGIAHDMEGL